MRWPISLYRVLYPGRPYVWCRIWILRETKKAILVYSGGRAWVPKSLIGAIRLNGNTFEIYVKEGTLG